MRSDNCAQLVTVLMHLFSVTINEVEYAFGNELLVILSIWLYRNIKIISFNMCCYSFFHLLLCSVHAYACFSTSRMPF